MEREREGRKRMQRCEGVIERKEGNTRSEWVSDVFCVDMCAVVELCDPLDAI